jgi:hypothetical protein
MNLKIRIRTIIRIRKLNILLIIILVTLPTVIAHKADLTEHDYLSILAEFKYAVESSITRFNDFITLVASFIITVHDQDYQLAKYRDYASSLLAEFIYSLTDPNTITTIAKTTSMHIASDFNAEEQESITAIRYSLLDISISVDTVVVKEGEEVGGDNNQW